MKNDKNKEQNKLLLVLFLGVLMGALDIAVVGPALNPIKGYFGVGSRDITWIFNAYVLMNLVGTPILSKCSDIAGRKVIYMLSIVLFAAGSIIVILAPAFTTVVLGRAVQGFGAGGIFPVASAVIGDTFPPEKRGSALGLIGAVFGIAFIIGPILGGVLLMLGWQWIFIINLPMAALLLYLSSKNLPTANKVKNTGFDVLGTAILSLMLVYFVFGINQLDTAHFLRSLASRSVMPYLACAVVLLLLLVYIEKKAKNPVLPVEIMSSREVRLAYFLSFGAGACEASLVFIPMLAVSAFSVTSSVSSFLLLPLVLAMAVGSPAFGRLLDKKGSKTVILIGTASLSAGMLCLAAFIGSWMMYFVSTMIIGFGLSALLGAPIRYILLNESDSKDRSSAQGLMVIFASIGQLMGAAAIGAVISSSGSSLKGFGTVYMIIGVFAIILLAASTQLKSKSTLADKQS